MHQSRRNPKTTAAGLRAAFVNPEKAAMLVLSLPTLTTEEREHWRAVLAELGSAGSAATGP